MERISSSFLMGYAHRSGTSFLQITHSFIANEIMNNFNLYFFTVAQPPYQSLYAVLPRTIRSIAEWLSFAYQSVPLVIWMVLPCTLPSSLYFWQTSGICPSRLERSF